MLLMFFIVPINRSKGQQPLQSGSTHNTACQLSCIFGICLQLRQPDVQVGTTAQSSICCCIAHPQPASHHRPFPSLLQTLPHKLPLRKAQPPFTRRSCPILKNPRQQPHSQLLPNLTQIHLQRLGFVPVGWRVEHLVQGEAWIAGNREVRIEGDVLDFFLCLSVAETQSVNCAFPPCDCDCV